MPKTESLTIEFKISFNEDVIETLVAFANAKGGTVYIGMKDNGDIVGTQVGKETIQQWINEIKTKTSPQIIPDVELLNIDNKTIISFFIIEYPIKPVSIRGKYFKRVGNSNHLLSVDEISNEYLKTINSSWDFYFDPNHSESDLSDEKISKFVSIIKQNGGILQTGLSDKEMLNKMEILRHGKVTFGAYLLFVKDYCTISDVQIGRFKSETTIIDSLSLNCELFKEVDEIMAFIKRHLKIEYIITGEPQRTERFDYPLDAIREIVINMVVHRDYRDSSASIIKIFDNRIEFYNPGNLYGGITVQDLLSGNYTSKSRNKLIAKAFKEVGMIERYGSGIMRVRKICKDYGVIDPDFKEVFNGFQVILYSERITKPYPVTDVTDVTDKVNDKVTNVTDKVTDKVTNVTNKVTNKVTDNQQAIIKLIMENNTVSANEISKIIGMSKRKVLQNMLKLKEIKILERVGNNKSGYWEIIDK